MKKYFYFIIIISLFSASCEEPIDFKLKDAHLNLLSVDGSFTTENKIQKIILTRSAYYYTNQPVNPETGAEVSITDGTNIFQLTDTNNDGIYETETETAGEEGSSYTLNIVLQNGEQFKATSKIIQVGNIDSITYQYDTPANPMIEGEKSYNIKFNAQEDPLPGNYYMFDIFLNDTLLTDTISEKVFTDDKYFNGSYIDNLDLYSIEDKLVKKDINTVTVKMYSISKAQYEFLVAAMLETVWKGSPFDGPPANVPSNINNGAVGFFSAMSVKTAQMTVYRKRNKP